MKLFSLFKKIGQSLKKPRSTIDALSVIVSLNDLEKIVLKSIDKRSIINVAAEHLNMPVDLLLIQIAERLQVPVAKQILPVDPATLGGTFAFKKYQEIGAIPLVTNGLLTGICGVDPEICSDLPISSLPFYLSDWARIEKALELSIAPKPSTTKSQYAFQNEFELINKVLTGVVKEVQRYGGKQVTLVNTSKALSYQFETGDGRFAEGEVHQRAIPAFRLICEQVHQDSELSKKLIDNGIVIVEKSPTAEGLAELTWYATPELHKAKKVDSQVAIELPHVPKEQVQKSDPVDENLQNHISQAEQPEIAKVQEFVTEAAKPVQKQETNAVVAKQEVKVVSEAQPSNDELTRKMEDQKAAFILNASKDLNKTQRENGVMRILVLEDNPTFAKVLQRFLEKEGYQVDHAKNGNEALEILRNSALDPHDLIISDVHMPGSNGFDFLHAVRDLDQRYELPIIMLTSDNDIETELKFIGWGVEAFVSKSADPRILGAHVKRVISKINEAKSRRVAA